VRALAAVLLAALHLGAASLPCPPAFGDAAAPAGQREGAVHATHSHGASTAHVSLAASRDLRAPCPCGCRHASSEVPAARLGPALLRVAPRLAPAPGSSPLAVAEPLLAAAAPGALDPVPRAA
jgi:hypothetical protein